MTATRVERGLFRLWLVTAVLWACAAVAMVWQHEQPFDWVAVGECPALNCVTHVVWLEEVSLVARNSAALALIPPALVLVVGAAFVWAFRGFRA